MNQPPGVGPPPLTAAKKGWPAWTVALAALAFFILGAPTLVCVGSAVWFAIDQPDQGRERQAQLAHEREAADRGAREALLRSRAEAEQADGADHAPTGECATWDDEWDSSGTRPMGSAGHHGSVWCTGFADANAPDSAGAEYLMCVTRAASCHCAEVASLRSLRGQSLLACREVHTLWCFDAHGDDGYQCGLTQRGCRGARGDWIAMVPGSSPGRCEERYAH